MDEQIYMKRAIELAQKGRGFTNPNPMVGAVVVKDGRIIGEGYHERYGELHAERNALAACTDSPAGAAIYVTLEPCCHYGKTPPCTEAIIEAGITRVIIGSRDPNPKVVGKGAAILRKAGIEVQEDFMRAECDAFNTVFFHYITAKTPYVIMKYAMTADGKIATHTGASKWITGEQAREHVHMLRHNCSGIMVGSATVLADDPMLNCRLEGGQSPIRIICDSQLKTPLASQLVRTAKEVPVIIAASHPPDERKKALEAAGVQVLDLPDGNGRVDLKKLMVELGAQGIDSILLEGGAELNFSALAAGIIQKCCVYIGAKLFGGETSKGPVGGSGIALPQDAFELEEPAVTVFGKDILLEYDRKTGKEQRCLQELSKKSEKY